MAVIMLALTAACQSSGVQSRKSPGGGPPALFTKMSTSPAAANALSRPSGVVISQATAVTLAPVAALISSAVRVISASVREQIVTFTPSRAKEVAQPRPSPLLAAQTSAFFPAIPRSIFALRCSGCFFTLA